MTPDADKPVVLFFRGSLCELSSRALGGISDFANAMGWSLQIIEFSAAAESRFFDKNDKTGTVDVKSLLRFWHPAGCIVECFGRTPLLQPMAFGKVPVVFFDGYPSECGRGAVCVSSDATGVVSVAARELLSLGVEDYAYVPWPEDTKWSKERGEEFARIVKMHGGRCHMFARRTSISRFVEQQKVFARWCKTLPKPCAVFAVNDIIAARLAVACGMAGVSVPGDVFIVGVDDIESICENSRVTLSSVRTNHEKGGRIAAELLASWMGGVKPDSRVFGASGLVRRESSRLIKGDIRVQLAIEFIRKNACHGITPLDVARHIGCCRRLADAMFRASLDSTVLDMIHSARIECVKSMLSRPGQSISAIPALCGYSSVEDLCRVFRRRTGMTMRQFRESATAWHQP